MKNLIEWDASLSVQVKEIDKQHQKLVELINKAYRAKDKEEINKIINELVEYTRVHFSTEEKYFEEFNYPEKAEHEEEHANLITKVLEFKKDLDSGKIDIKEFLDFLSKWLEDHLKIMDQKYVKCFKNNGLK